MYLRSLPLLALSGLLSLGLAGCVSRGDVEAMSADEFAKMRTEIPVTRNASQRAYVICVVNKIAAELPPPYDGVEWDVEVFDQESVNAFAMAGGKIGVFTGIFKVAEDQDQLAAVIGHEIAHVTEDHTIERINRAQMTGGAIAATSIIVGDQTGLGQQNTQTILEGAAQFGLLMPFGRGQESEADLVGLDYMAAAGFDPRASVQLWKNMAAENGGAPPEFLSTHPSPDTRTSDLIRQMPEALVLYNEAVAKGKTPRCGW